MLTVIVNYCRESETTIIEEINQVQAITNSTDSINTFQMKVYPNPNTGHFTIELSMSSIKEEKIKMRIVNILGQEIYNKEFFTYEEYLKENVELDRSIPTGTYTLMVILGNKVESTGVMLAR